MKRALCLDIGGSKLLSGIVNAEGNVLSAGKLSLKGCDGEDIKRIIVSVSRDILSGCSDEDMPDCIGVSIPGLADPQAGKWKYAPFSGISDLPVRDILEEEFGLPVALENDCNICALGEKVYGAAKDYNDFIWITVSNGIGSGLFLDGKIYEGSSGGAGELGHMNLIPGGRKCPCGRKGCFEGYAAGPGIKQSYFELTGKTAESAQIAEAARGGDRDALKIFELEGEYLGRGIAHAANLLNLPLAVIGGGVSGAFDLFIPSIEKTLEKELYTPANADFKVVRTALGYEASLIGAGALAFDYLNKK